jgi:hypothetical protein
MGNSWNARLDRAIVSLADFDDFWLFAVLALALVSVVFHTKRSVAEKGGTSGRNRLDRMGELDSLAASNCT